MIDAAARVIDWTGLNAVANFLVLVNAVLAVAFLLLYFTRSRWQQTRVGRSLIYLSASIAAFLMNASLSIFFPGYPGQGAVRSVVYLSVALTLAGMLWTLLRVQAGDPKYLSELHKSMELDEPRNGAISG